MIKDTIIAVSLATLTIFTAVDDFQKEIPKPVQVKEEIGRTKARYALEYAGAPKERLVTLTRSAYAASIGTDIDPIMIATIMKPESEYKITAKSPKGYKSLMQTKEAYVKWEFAEANVMAGACVLREKLQAAGGNLDKAMVYYKGHGGKESQIIAAKQMAFYRDIKHKVEERIKKEEQTNGR